MVDGVLMVWRVTSVANASSYCTCRLQYPPACYRAHLIRSPPRLRLSPSPCDCCIGWDNRKPPPTAEEGAG
ncbi:hypothetical protein P280DRAFT_185750 [Massarina eburnea CBS 473.64]|uniref:Uncharacterized protein n=1 Tax=Massarina eburnea CBS 473.64 TaxID=1395130 RepID=A0A6A6SCX6_9PLEO|nr:hypothetical protein P280DRAFT_185750 [Massarina eburnea CBS 473.64]